jgi:hypothetical protein
VEIRMKRLCELMVRIPEWVTPDQCAFDVDGSPRNPSWEGRYAALGPVESGQTATLTFPMQETTHTVEIERTTYSITRKGNDVMTIDPPGENYPLYQRERFRASEATRRTVTRFLANTKIDW